mgnify:CR=1 FL=1
MLPRSRLQNNGSRRNGKHNENIVVKSREGKKLTENEIARNFILTTMGGLFKESIIRGGYEVSMQYIPQNNGGIPLTVKFLTSNGIPTELKTVVYLKGEEIEAYWCDNARDIMEITIPRSTMNIGSLASKIQELLKAAHAKKPMQPVPNGQRAAPIVPTG